MESFVFKCTWMYLCVVSFFCLEDCFDGYEDFKIKVKDRDIFLFGFFLNF